jgi:hypothetical protein
MTRFMNKWIVLGAMAMAVSCLGCNRARIDTQRVHELKREIMVAEAVEIPKLLSSLADYANSDEAFVRVQVALVLGELGQHDRKKLRLHAMLPAQLGTIESLDLLFVPNLTRLLKVIPTPK